MLQQDQVVCDNEVSTEEVDEVNKVSIPRA